MRKQPLQFLQVPRAISILLKSSFFFELDSPPQFQCGLFLCTGTVRCRTPPKQTIEALLSLYPGQISFYKNNIDLGVYLLERDICGSYRWYNRPLQFYIRDLREVITISLHYEGRQNALSQFPQSMKWFSERQGLDNKFGVANNRSLFRCGVCEDLRVSVIRKREYVAM